MLKEMEYVYAVYQEKSFSKAAEKLFVSQPALSAVIKKVEAEINLPLFDRSSNPIKLTAAGEYYIESIKKIMEIQKDMTDHFSNMLDSKKGSLTVGGASFFCAHVLPTIIQAFREKFPGYTMNLLEANACDLGKCLQSGVIDISLDMEALDPALYHSVVWKVEHIVLAVPAFYEINSRLKDYRLTFQDIRSEGYLHSKYPPVDLHHFANEPFLLLKKGNDMYRRSIKICRNAGFKPNVAMYFDQLLTSYYVACGGKGLTFVRTGITQYVEATDKLYFYKIDDKNSTRNIMLHYRKSAPLSKIGADFLCFMNDICR